jgi:NAD-dependent DNA ligase
MSELELYNEAKKSYYSGNPIMEDLEFDELEKSLGLENKSFIGTKHNLSYTVKHPVVMGSLSKVQIKEGLDGNIDWQKYLKELHTYLHHKKAIVTPKYDGCSFEAVYMQEHDETGFYKLNTNLVSISTRGDGSYGKDISKHISRQIAKLTESASNLNFDKAVFRGEVLIDKNVFEQKYNNFTNPRSFVAGILNREYDENDKELRGMLNDLSLVIYDFRKIDCTKNDNGLQDMGWYCMKDIIPYTPEHYYNNIYIESISDLKVLYNDFEEYRKKCAFALDGFVIKTNDADRVNNIKRIRPSDCVAIKFVPILEETEVVSIEWNTGKTNELHPVIITKPVIMDGKLINKASAHNYGYIIDNKISIGTKVILSLAGDIIPFIYKITDTKNYNENKLCLPSVDTYIDGCHLFQRLSENELKKQKFIESANVLNIPSIGPAAAAKIYDYLVLSSVPDEFLGITQKEAPDNILLCTSADIYTALGGKLGQNAMKAFDEYRKNLTLKDIIMSCIFDGCGDKVSEAIEDYLLNGNKNFEHLASKAWWWIADTKSGNYQRLMSVISALGKKITDFRKVDIEDKKDKIAIIMTGEPNNYATKSAFLQAHPEYRETTSWKDVQIVFTSSYDSNTGKMKKAKEKNIEIRLY